MPRQAPETWAAQLGFADLEAAEGLPHGLLTAIVTKESRGNPTAKSPKGAAGLFQFMPATAAGYGIDPLNPTEAAPAAAKELSSLYRKYGGDLKKTVAAWNWGQGNLDRKGLARAPGETQDFVRFMTERVGEDLSGRIAARLTPAKPRGLGAMTELVTPETAEAATPGSGEDLSGIIAQRLQAGRQQVTQPQATPAMVKLSPQMTDNEIAASLGYDYDLIRQSKYYRDGMLQKRVTDPNSQLARTMDSVLGGIAMGARSNLAGMNQLVQRGLKVVGLGDEADVALADLATDLATSDYAQNIRQGRTVDPKTGRLPFEVGQMVGGMLVPSPLGMVAGKAVGALGAGAGRVGQGVGMVARGATYGAAGGLEAPVEGARGQDITTAKLGQVGLGAGAGALLGPLAETVVTPGVSKVLNAAQNRRALPQYDEIEALGERYATRLSAGDIAGQEAPNLARQETLLEQVPGIGLAGYRRGQQGEAQTAVAETYDTLLQALGQRQYRGLAAIEREAAGTGARAKEAQGLVQAIRNAGEDWQQIIQVSGTVQRFATKLRSDKLYAEMDTMAEPLGRAVAPTKTLQALDTNLGLLERQSLPLDVAATSGKPLADRLRAAGATPRPLPSERARSTLEDIRARLTGSEASLTPGPAAGAPVTYAQLRGLRADVDDLISAAQKNDQPQSVRLLSILREGIQEDLTTFATTSGIPALERAARRADKYYQRAVIPFEEASIARALQAADADTVYNKFITRSTTPDRAQRIYQALDPKGRAAIQVGMVSEAIERGTHPTTGAFSPAKFAQYLETVRDSYGVFFRGEQKAHMDGFLNLMRHLPRASAFAENPPTGSRAISATVGGAVGAGALTFPTETVTAGAVTLLARELFTTQAGKRLLLASASLPPNAARWETVLTRLTELLPQAAGRERAKGETPRSIDPPARLSIDITK